MKKLFTILAALILTFAMALCAVAESSALDAFRHLTGQDVLSEEQKPIAVKTGVQYLDEVMSGAYSVVDSGVAGMQDVAATLEGLSAITTQDLAAYAAARGLTVRQVRNAYYRALANVLRAEINLNPGSEERYRSVQVILSLFLNDDDIPANEEARIAIRRSMTPDYAAGIAEDYDLPTDFVAFIIMDDDWDDDDWENDDDWEDDADDTWAWGVIINGSPALGEGDRDDASSFRIAELQERLISLGYLSGKADGIFGRRTQTALREFQLSNGLKPTGHYDADDARRIFSDDVVARWNYEEDFYDSNDDDYYDDLYDDSNDDRSYNDTNDDRGYNDTNDDRAYDDSDDDRPAKTTSRPRQSYDDSDDDDRPAKTKATVRPQKSYSDSYDDSYDDSDD